jgi:hypothetical protein
MATSVEKKTVTGQSMRGLSAAIDDAARQIGDDSGLWKPVDWEVEVEHHSPSHVQWFRVTLQKQ